MPETAELKDLKLVEASLVERALGSALTAARTP